jgi:hypothetical protein
MTKVSVTENKRIVDMLGWDKVWSFKSRVEVPLSHVGEVHSAAGERVRGFRCPGTSLPGVITAGTYRRIRQKEFWAVHDSRQAIAIELRDEQFSRLVVQVPDPGAAIAEIRSALAPVGASQLGARACPACRATVPVAVA